MVWRGAGQSHILALTPEGMARARRLQAPAGIDPFISQHGDIVREARFAGHDGVNVNTGESPVAWLARRRDRDGMPFLGVQHIEAGERFRRDVTMAQMLPSVKSNWSAHSSGGRRGGAAALLPSDMALAARQRIDRALASVGPEFAGLVLDVCGFLKGLELVETERGWPSRSAKIVVRLALGSLARHYGLAAAARGPASAKGVVHWGAPDFRPEIDG